MRRSPSGRRCGNGIRAISPIYQNIVRAVADTGIQVDTEYRTELLPTSTSILTQSTLAGCILDNNVRATEVCVVVSTSSSAIRINSDRGVAVTFALISLGERSIWQCA
eukprot:2964601-Pleurochrysis_carterae.AAC.3